MLMPASWLVFLLYLLSALTSLSLAALAWPYALGLSAATALQGALVLCFGVRLATVAMRRERLDAWSTGLPSDGLRWAGLGLMVAGLIGGLVVLFGQGDPSWAWLAGAGLLLFETSRLLGFEGHDAARRPNPDSSVLATSQAPGLDGMVSVPPEPPRVAPRSDVVRQGVVVEISPLPPSLHLLLHKHGLVEHGRASSNCMRAVLGLKGQGLAYAAVDLHMRDGTVRPYALLRLAGDYHDPSGEAHDEDVREVRVRKGLDAEAITRVLVKGFGKDQAVTMLRSGQPLPELKARPQGGYGF